MVYWFKIWVGTNQEVVGSDPWAFCAWLLTLFCSKRTVPIISRAIIFFWIKVSAKWPLTHSHKLLGCLILLQQCVLVVTLFLVRRLGVPADALLKVWTALLLSPVAHPLSFLCATNCLPVFTILVSCLWAFDESLFPFSRWLCPSPGHATAGPAPQTCWDMGSGTCLVSALQQSYFAGLTLGFVHSANMFVSMVQASHLCLSLIIVKNWALGYIYRPKRLEFACRSVKIKYCTFSLFNIRYTLQHLCYVSAFWN